MIFRFVFLFANSAYEFDWSDGSFDRSPSLANLPRRCDARHESAITITKSVATVSLTLMDLCHIARGQSQNSIAQAAHGETTKARLPTTILRRFTSKSYFSVKPVHIAQLTLTAFL